MFFFLFLFLNFQLNCDEYSKELYRFNIAALTQSPKKRKGETKKTRCIPITAKICNKENIIDDETVPHSLKERLCDNQVKVKIFYEPLIESKCEQNDKTKQCELGKGQTLLTSFFKVKRKSTTTAETNEIKNYVDFGSAESINNYEPTEPNNSNEIQKYLLLHRNRILRKYCKLNKRNYIVKNRLKRCLVLIIRSNKEQITRHWQKYSHNTNLLYVYQCILIYQQFTYAILTKEFQSEVKLSTDTIMINRRVQRILNENPNNGREANDDNNRLDVVCEKIDKCNYLQELLMSENANKSTEMDYCEFLNFHLLI